MPRRHRSLSPDVSEPRRKWRKVIIYSDSDSSSEFEKSDSEQQQNEEIIDDPTPPDSLPVNSAPAEEVTGQSAQPTPPQTGPSPEEPAIELDAELLAALGDPAEDIPVYGEKILQDLAQRWLPLLKKGIPKDKKETLLKEHTIPDNCKLLRAPTLNAEISAAISDISRARDKKLEASQNQLGLGISAVSRGLSLLLTNDDKQKKVQAIKSISEGCRILADLHYTETQSRVKLITPGLDKAFLHVIQDVERDESLFGSKLSDKIKASKTIEKQGLQIKKVPPTQKGASTTTTSRSHTTSRSRTQGNWASSSRYQPSNKGGRGGAYKYGAAARKAQPSTSASKAPAANSSAKQRAPTR